MEFINYNSDEEEKSQDQQQASVLEPTPHLNEPLSGVASNLLTQSQQPYKRLTPKQKKPLLKLPEEPGKTVVFIYRGHGRVVNTEIRQHKFDNNIKYFSNCDLNNTCRGIHLNKNIVDSTKENVKEISPELNLKTKIEIILNDLKKQDNETEYKMAQSPLMYNQTITNDVGCSETITSTMIEPNPKITGDVSKDDVNYLKSHIRRQNPVFQAVSMHKKINVNIRQDGIKEIKYHDYYYEKEWQWSEKSTLNPDDEDLSIIYTSEDITKDNILALNHIVDEFNHNIKNQFMLRSHFFEFVSTTCMAQNILNIGFIDLSCGSLSNEEDQHYKNETEPHPEHSGEITVSGSGASGAPNAVTLTQSGATAKNAVITSNGSNNNIVVNQSGN